MFASPNSAGNDYDVSLGDRIDLADCFIRETISAFLHKKALSDKEYALEGKNLLPTWERTVSF